MLAPGLLGSLLMLASCGSEPICDPVDWQVLAAGAPIVFVSAEAVSGGDGSEDLPLTSIQEALDRFETSTEAGVVAVQPGTYQERLEIRAGHDQVSLIGACTEGVRIDGGDLGDPTIKLVALPTTKLILRQLTLSAGAPGVDLVQGDLLLQDVRVEGCTRGLCVSADSQVVIEDSEILDNLEIGLYLREGRQATLSGSSVSRTMPGPDQSSAWGIYVIDGTLQIDECQLTENRYAGLVAIGESSVKAQALEIRGTLAAGEDGPTWGAYVGEGTYLELRESTLADNDFMALSVTGGQAVLEQVEVLDTRRGSGLGAGILVWAGGSLSMTGGQLVGNHRLSMVLADAGSHAELEDVAILDTELGDDGQAAGLLVMDGAQLEAWDCRLQGNALLGLGIYDEGCLVRWHGGGIDDTMTGEHDEAGWGVYINDGQLEMSEGFSLGNNFGHGLAADGGAEVTLIDGEIRNTLRNASQRVAIGVNSQDEASVEAWNLRVEGTSGPGLLAAIGGEVSCSGCTIQDNGFAGAAVVAGGQLEIEDSSLTATRSDELTAGGIEVFADSEYGACSLLLEGNTIEAGTLAAVYLRDEGTYQLIDNTIIGGDGSSRADEGTWPRGNAVFADGDIAAWDEDDGSGLRIEANTLKDSAGGAVFLNGAAAWLTTNSFDGNALDVWQQRCGADPPEPVIDDTSDTLLCPHEQFDVYVEEMHLEYRTDGIDVTGYDDSNPGQPN